MPKKTGEPGEDDLERRQAADRIALESGRLPFAAIERLEQQRNSPNKTFSSDLSTREFLLLQNSQVRPLGQVMGSAFMSIPSDQAILQNQSANRNSAYTQSERLREARFHQDMMFGNKPPGSSQYSAAYRTFREPITGELSDLTRGRLEVRRSAFSRMEMEAGLLGASGVVGVRTITRVHDWAGKTIEFTVFGTAVHIPSCKEEQPFMSLLNGQEFWQLWNAGFEPRGIALGVCSYTDCTDSTAIHGRNYNQEIAAYTQCFYEAREIAMRRLVADLKRMKARGAVGMKIDYDFEEAESELEVSETSSVKYLHLVTHLVVMGTAIARRNMDGQVVPKPSTMLIYDLRKPGSASVEFTAHRKKGAGRDSGEPDSAEAGD